MKPKIGFGLAAFVLGTACGAYISVVFIHEERYFLLFVAELLLISALGYLAVYLIDTFLVPYLNRRRFALRALGRHGIKAVMKSGTARTCYRGIYAMLSGKYSKAETLLTDALNHSDIRQNQLFCTEWLGHVYEELHLDTKTMWCYRRSAELAPDDPEVQTRLGQAYMEQGSLDKAEYCFNQALHYDPNNGYSYYNLAIIKKLRGEDSAALDTMHSARRINENHPLVQAELALFYAMDGDEQQSTEYMKKSILCGYRDPDMLTKRVKAILEYGQSEVSADDLPHEYYRRIEPKGEPAEEGTQRNG